LNTELLKIWEKTGSTIVFVTHSIRESVLLSDRVIVLTNRPSFVKEIVKIEIPRPRPSNIELSDQYSHYFKRIRDLLII
jgi:NitT/TauT family transport system ATP-binding protein